MVSSNPEVQALFDAYELDMMSVVDHLKSDFATIRAGRANPNILNKVAVDYYGTMTPLNQMANIVVPEARLLQITPWDASTVREIVKAITASDIGITPSDDGKVIRLVFPQLTEERRKELTKQVKKTGEDYKVSLRNERRDIVDKLRGLKKNNLITEDELATFEKEVQKMLDAAVASVDALIKAKETEIIEV